MSTTSIAISNLPQEEQEALKAAVFQRLHPRVYFERFLAEKLRPDGREFDAWRPVSVNVGQSILFPENTLPLLYLGTTNYK